MKHIGNIYPEWTRNSCMKSIGAQTRGSTIHDYRFMMQGYLSSELIILEVQNSMRRETPISSSSLNRICYPTFHLAARQNRFPWPHLHTVRPSFLIFLSFLFSSYSIQLSIVHPSYQVSLPLIVFLCIS